MWILVPTIYLYSYVAQKVVLGNVPRLFYTSSGVSETILQLKAVRSKLVLCNVGYREGRSPGRVSVL